MSWYEDEEHYTDPGALPPEFEHLAGPRGVALLDVYTQGRTTPGWGLVGSDGKPGFMHNYTRRRFRPTPRLLAYEQGRPFAIVMRSLRLVAVDIDRHFDDPGAPDGFKSARKLDLPPTISQTSRSGQGRHLFYQVDDVWDDELGFAKFDDVIGIAPGIDIRGVGCIYRYPTQRWNLQWPLRPLPVELHEMLLERQQRKTIIQQKLAATAAAPDTEEALIMIDALEQELARPIPTGKRNTTLFAIGSKMRAAAVPQWDEKVIDRAIEIGLDRDEAEKLIRNIERYA